MKKIKGENMYCKHQIILSEKGKKEFDRIFNKKDKIKNENYNS